MHTNDANYQKLVDRIEKTGKIQESLADVRVDASQEEIDQIFQQIPKEFLASKNKFDVFLQAVISNLFGGSHRERTTLLILEKLKEQIGNFYKNDEIHLIKMVEPYIFVNEWFFENNFLSTATIINEARYDSKLSQYFLPEIIENKPSLFYEYLLTANPKEYHKDLYLPIKQSDDTSFSKAELNEIKKRRKNQIQLFIGQNRDFESYYSYDPSILRCSIMSDDIERFQDILSKNNISINSCCPPSIYDPSYFPKVGYNETRTLIEAAALFGSIKIFKFLLLNNAELRPKEIFRRVLFGRNIDIFHMVEKHIMEDAVLKKIRSKDYKSCKDQKTKNYVNLYMNNPVSESDFETSTESSNSEKKDDDSNDDDDSEDMEENENEEESDEFLWILKERVHKNTIIRQHFSNCMMYSIKYGCDDISDYLYDNYETMIDFEINTSIISEREVNFCLKNFKEKLLPIFIHYPNDKDEFENTYLMNAAYFNYPDIVKLLLKMPNIDINLINPRNKTTALSRAADQHSFKTMEILLKSPLFEYKYDYYYDQFSPFSKAAAHGYIDEMMLLIETKKNNENDERFEKLLDEREIISALKAALTSNQSEATKLIMDTFQDTQFFKNKGKNLVEDAIYKKSWDALMCLADILNDNEQVYEQKFPYFDFQEFLDYIQSELKNNLDENAIK